MLNYKYPHIISTTKTTPTCVTLGLFIAKDIIFFQGHFPETAILPGIVQIDWAIFFGRNFFNIPLNHPPTIEHVKFTNIISPDTALFLALKLENTILNFKYFAEDTKKDIKENIIYSKGKIII